MLDWKLGKLYAKKDGRMLDVNGSFITASALNELVAILSEKGILTDADNDRLEQHVISEQRAAILAPFVRVADGVSDEVPGPDA